MRLNLMLYLAVACLLPLNRAQADFRFPEDTYFFANQLYYDYATGPDGFVHARPRKDGTLPDFSRHCFQMVRSVLQFYRFARFVPDAPKLTEAEYQSRLLRLNRYPPWSGGPREKIEFPGYANLYEFSKDYTKMIEHHLGAWQFSYWRIPNWRMVNPMPRWGQQKIADWLIRSLDKGGIESVFITRFHPINHCLVVFAYHRLPNGDVDFETYDCDQPAKVVYLHYRLAERSFVFDRNWYWTGGVVNVLKVFSSPLT